VKEDILMRLISNPSMLNDPELKVEYAALWGPLSPPQLADVCELIMNARKSFPGQYLVAARVDVKAAYNHILNSLYDMCRQCFLFSMDCKDRIAIPIVCTFDVCH
jgi:hypothetical protein